MCKDYSDRGSLLLIYNCFYANLYQINMASIVKKIFSTNQSDDKDKIANGFVHEKFTIVTSLSLNH